MEDSKINEALCSMLIRDVEYFKEENQRLIEIIKVICQNNKIDSNILKNIREKTDPDE